MIAAGRIGRIFPAFAFAATLAGCASRPAEHFYTVSTASAATSISDPDVAGPRIVVSPIVIPALIDRPQLVVRTSEHEIAVLENHRWSEALTVDLTRTLLNDLRQRRPGADVVAVSAAPQGQRSEQILDVVIDELISGPGSSTSLQASWNLYEGARDCASHGNFRAAIPTPAGYEAIPAAYAEAMSRLAEAITKAIAAKVTCARD